MQRLARAGAGVAVLPDHFVEPYVRAGELTPVLGDGQLPTVFAWAVFPGRRLMPASTRVFLDALQAKFSGAEGATIEAKARETKRARRNWVRPAARFRDKQLQLHYDTVLCINGLSAATVELIVERATRHPYNLDTPR